MIKNFKLYSLIFLFPALFVFNAVSAKSDADSAYKPVNDYTTLARIDSLLSQKHYNTLNNNHFDIPVDISESNSASNYVNDDSLMNIKMEAIDKNTPISLVFNSRVKNYIRMYARKTSYMARVMAISERYFPLFEKILDKYNMPLELKYLAVVESALKPHAVSRARAVGLWQFIYSTGRLYNLNSTSLSDARMNPYKETEAACKYMSNLYEIYHNWDLVLAAYNCGTGNVNRAIRRSGGKTNYWDIINYLPRETRGYVPAFIAMNYVFNYANELGISPNYSELDYDYSYYSLDTIHVHHSYSFDFLSQILGMPKDLIANLNPSYRFGYIPASTSSEPMTLCLPADKMGYFITNRDNIYAYQAYRDSLGQDPKKEALKNRIIVHRVTHGENLGYIAEHYHCSVRQLKVWNHLHSNFLRVGQHLKIFLDGGEAIARYQRSHKPYNTKATTIKSGKYAYHVVQKGDTLWDIAKLYDGVSVEDLKQLNKNIDFRHLKPGTRIKVKILG